MHTAILALGNLVHQRELHHINLTIVGAGDSNYETHLRQLARQQNVESFVVFLGTQPKEAMPQLYAEADVFLFTSIWPEPFGRVLVEAMASGVVVVGAATGGAEEIMTEGVNALTFPPGDAPGLAAQIWRLVEKPSLLDQLAEAGRRTATERFEIQRMIEEIEAYLQAVVVKQ